MQSGRSEFPRPNTRQAAKRSNDARYARNCSCSLAAWLEAATGSVGWPVECTRANLILVFLLAGTTPQQGRAQSSTLVQSGEPHVAIIGVDYAFVQLPATLVAGPTLFSFENRGTQRHEMSIALLKPGVALESLLAAKPASVSSRAVSDSIIGLLLARPGERSGGRLYANLISGRTYVVVCTLRDTPDARQHRDLGMLGIFRVP